MEAVKHLNPTIWVFAALLILWVCVQSGWYLKLTSSFNKRNNILTKEQLNECMKIGVSAAIGPAMNAIAVALTLIAMVGSATTFMRCGVIGAPGWELYMAQIASSTAGVSFGTPEFTEEVMTFALFCMVLASAPYFVNTMITLKPLDMAVEKAKSGGGVSYTSFMGNAAMYSMLTYTICGYFKEKDKLVCLFVSLGAALVVNAIVKKTGNKTLATFSMVICMIFGMIAGQVAYTALIA